jgi:hypothetical protein
LTARVAQTIALERAVMSGVAVDPALDTLATEFADHLRALLRDVLCGHVDADLRSVADDIIGQDAGTQPVVRCSGGWRRSGAAPFTSSLWAFDPFVVNGLVRDAAARCSTTSATASAPRSLGEG